MRAPSCHENAARAGHDRDHDCRHIPKHRRDGEHNPPANRMTLKDDKRMVPHAWRPAMDQG
jgi:hypothetical protein